MVPMGRRMAEFPLGLALQLRRGQGTLRQAPRAPLCTSHSPHPALGTQPLSGCDSTRAVSKPFFTAGCMAQALCWVPGHGEGGKASSV